jgi:hypothetical protein
MRIVSDREGCHLSVCLSQVRARRQRLQAKQAEAKLKLKLKKPPPDTSARSSALHPHQRRLRGQPSATTHGAPRAGGAGAVVAVAPEFSLLDVLHGGTALPLAAGWVHTRAPLPVRQGIEYVRRFETAGVSHTGRRRRGDGFTHATLPVSL